MRGLDWCNRTTTISVMYTIRQLPEFVAWLSGLKDGMTRLRLARRLEKVQRGNLGDVKQIGEGVGDA